MEYHRREHIGGIRKPNAKRANGKTIGALQKLTKSITFSAAIAFYHMRYYWRQ